MRLDGAPVEGRFIGMIDDGLEHSAVFPPRALREAEAARPRNLAEKVEM